MPLLGLLLLFMGLLLLFVGLLLLFVGLLLLFMGFGRVLRLSLMLRSLGNLYQFSKNAVVLSSCDRQFVLNNFNCSSGKLNITLFS
jgi:hypothetical protein